MTAAPAIEFRRVSVWFDETRALDDVSFALDRGRMLILTGASRAGKSVLLHVAIGLVRPDAGEVLIEGRDIAALSERELLRLRGERMGLAFQEDTLFTSLDVYENAAYRLYERGWPDAQVDAAVEEILRFVGLERDAGKLPEELSIGMRRRLEIARGMIGWPPIMLYDEPTSGLDPLNSRQVLDLVIRARDVYSVSSLYVTKEMHEIPYLAGHRAVRDARRAVTIAREAAPRECDLRVMVLDEGRVAFLGGAAEFQQSAEPAVTRLTMPGLRDRLVGAGEKAGRQARRL